MSWTKYEGKEKEDIVAYTLTLLRQDTEIQKKAGSGHPQTDWSPFLKEAFKAGCEIAISGNPLEEMINIIGRNTLAQCLSSYGCSQVAGILGMVASTFCPGLTMSLLVKQIGEDLRKINQSLAVVRTSPQHMANFHLQTAIDNFKDGRYDETLEHLKSVVIESARGSQMTPNFEGFLAVTKMKIFASLLLETAAELQEGVKVFLPIHCLPESKKLIIQRIIENGLNALLQRAEETSSVFKRLPISKKRQDQLDPYLGKELY